MQESLENSKSAFWKKKEKGNAFLQALKKEEEPWHKEESRFKIRLILKRASKMEKSINFLRITKKDNKQSTMLKKQKKMLYSRKRKKNLN